MTAPKPTYIVLYKADQVIINGSDLPEGVTAAVDVLKGELKNNVNVMTIGIKHPRDYREVMLNRIGEYDVYPFDMFDWHPHLINIGLELRNCFTVLRFTLSK